jgi:hypothetical protein
MSALEQTNEAASAEGYVFISYARKDQAFAHQLVKDLRAGKKKVWFDGDIQKGEPWDQEIEKHVLGASELYLVMSPAAKKSEYTMGEATSARAHGINVVPVLFRECVLPPPYNMLQWVDCTTLEKYREGLPKLLGPNPSPVKVRWYVRYLVWDRWIGALATIAVLLALAGYSYYRFKPSETSVKFGQNNKVSTISLLLENRGGRSSTNLGGYRIKFGDLPIVDTRLDEVGAPTTVEGHTTYEVVLEPKSGFEPKAVGGRFFTADEIEKMLPGHKITIDVDIEESADPAPGRPHHTYMAKIDATSVGGFITQHLPNTRGVPDEP